MLLRFVSYFSRDVLVYFILVGFLKILLMWQFYEYFYFWYVCVFLWGYLVFVVVCFRFTGITSLRVVLCCFDFCDGQYVCRQSVFRSVGGIFVIIIYKGGLGKNLESFSKIFFVLLKFKRNKVSRGESVRGKNEIVVCYRGVILFMIFLVLV